MTDTKKAVGAALALYVVWTFATWLLEGRIETLLRPEADIDRLVYAVVANLGIGLLGASVILRRILRRRILRREHAGFGPPARTALAVATGFAAGLALYALAGGPTSNPVVLANVFAQVLVVSAAEVIVCWAVVAGVFEAALRSLDRKVATGLAAVIASELFGVYHVGHSPPFNSPEMIAFLSVVGLATSLVFVVSRDVYGTIVFHNFMAVLGVANALAAKGQLAALSQVQPRLLATGATAVLIVAATDRLILRRAVPRA